MPKKSFSVANSNSSKNRYPDVVPCKKTAKKQKSPTLAYAKGKRKLKTERLNSRRQILAADSAGGDKVSSPEDKQTGILSPIFVFLSENLAQASTCLTTR